MATIRPMTPADYAAVAGMAGDAALQTLVGRPLWELESDVAAEVATVGERGAFVVAEDDEGRLAGVAGFCMQEHDEAEIYGPLVTAEGHGLGAWLESRVVSMAEARGATSYSMLIGLANRSGQAWAEWRGYLRDAEHPELLLTWLYPSELRPEAATPGALVRPAVSGDADRIQALLEECFPLERTRAADWSGPSWVVEHGGQVAGFLRLEPAVGWIHHLAVEPSLRRQGLGATLLTEVVTRFWQEHPRKVGLAVPLDDTTPVALFRRLGFRREIPVAKWMKR